MIEIRIKISKVDYEEVLDAIYPVVMEQVNKNQKIVSIPIIAKILPKIQDAGAAALKLLIRALPQETRDELTVACLNKFKGDILGLIEKEAKQRSIGIKVDDIDVLQQ